MSYAATVAHEWEQMEADGPLWIQEALDELINGSTKPVNVAKLCTPELDTYGLSAGALLQVLFSRGFVADADLLSAIKALREMVHAYGDGEAERRAHVVARLEACTL